MALTIPTLNQVAAFDAGYSQTFTFNVIGGDQVTGSILTIKTNDVAATTVATIETTSFDYIDRIYIEQAALSEAGHMSH